jgi:DNA-binding NarL/FixJ family response regulator
MTVLSLQTVFSPVRDCDFTDRESKMVNHTHIQANVVLFGLEATLAHELNSALVGFCDGVAPEPIEDSSECLDVLAAAGVNLVFCAPDVEVVRELRSARPKASIVVVSRLPEVMDWLDAMEAGADDYCAAPFEPAQMRWILESNLVASHMAA